MLSAFLDEVYNEATARNGEVASLVLERRRCTCEEFWDGDFDSIFNVITKPYDLEAIGGKVLLLEQVRDEYNRIGKKVWSNLSEYLKEIHDRHNF